MNESLKLILVNTLYLLAMINPISKVAVLSVTSTTSDPVQFRSVIQKSSIVAGLILLGTMIFGSFILKSVFHVELQALQIAGGSVLFIAGYNALRKGVFFESEAQKRLEDVALVPLACPMIAGPATIASSIALRTHYGLWLAGLSLILALLINFGIMRVSKQLGAILSRFNVLGALIRITGLIVMTIGVQMVLTGIRDWRLGWSP